MKNNPLYFLHIPKTGGVTLRGFLEDHYCIEEILFTEQVVDLLKLPPSEIKRKKLFFGHFGYFLPKLISQKPTVITLLREPTSRLLSLHKHMQRGIASGIEFVDFNASIINLDFLDFLSNADNSILPLVVNAQTAALAFDDIFEVFKPGSLAKLDEIIEVLTDESILRKALQRIETLDVVGVTEHYSNFIALVCFKMGWPIPKFDLEKLNANPFKASELTNSYYERMETHEFCKLDQVLYSRALEMQNDRYLSLTDDIFSIEYNKNMSLIDKKSFFNFGFEKAFLGSGWHSREFQSCGTAFRWTGPGNVSEMDISLDLDESYEITFFCAAYLETTLSSMSLYVNDVLIVLREIYPDYSKLSTECIFVGRIDSAIVGVNPAYTNLRFTVDSTVVPNDIDPKFNDNRSLGVYFKWLEITPMANTLVW
jgi:hypothetical protein